MDEAGLRALARDGAWAAVLDRVSALSTPAALKALGVSPDAAEATAAAACAWRVVSLIKLRRLQDAADALARLGDLDTLPGGAPWALRYATAWLPAAAGGVAAGAAAMADLVGWCGRRRATAPGEEADVWAFRGQTAALTTARLYARAGDPAAARAWARRALLQRTSGGGGGGPPSTAPLDTDLPGSGLDGPALDAAARLELALGAAASARRLFEAAAASATTTAHHARPPADAARAAALMRLAAGDAARAAAGFGAVAESADGDAVDAADEAVCLLHAGDLGAAAAGAARPLLGGGGGKGVDPAALTAAALRNAAALGDLAPDGRAARAALAAAVAAAGPPDDLDTASVFVSR